MKRNRWRTDCIFFFPNGAVILSKIVILTASVRRPVFIYIYIYASAPSISLGHPSVMIFFFMRSSHIATDTALIQRYEYSLTKYRWKWLESKAAAEAMAQEVATWDAKYGADGIDLDIEVCILMGDVARPHIHHHSWAFFWRL